jgi:hypothetical protein
VLGVVDVGNCIQYVLLVLWGARGLLMAAMPKHSLAICSQFQSLSRDGVLMLLQHSCRCVQQVCLRTVLGLNSAVTQSVDCLQLVA